MNEPFQNYAAANSWCDYKNRFSSPDGRFIVQPQIISGENTVYWVVWEECTG